MLEATCRLGAAVSLAALSLSLLGPAAGCRGHGGGEDPFADYVPDPEVYMAPIDADRVEVIEGELEAPVDQLMIQLRDGLERRDADAVAEGVGAEVVGQIPELEIYQLHLPTETVAELLAARETLAAHADVLEAVPNLLTQYHDGLSRPDYCHELDDNHTTLVGSQRCPHSEIDYYPMSVVYDAIRSEADLSTVRIAIIDTGLEMSTGQFQDVPVLWLDVPGETPSDTHGHGTAMTALIAADDQDGGINGIATRLLGPGKVQVLIGNSGGLSNDVVNMYRASEDAHADVVNMSWGWDFESHSSWWQSVANVLLQPIKNAPDTLFIAAAGNANKEVTLLQPPAGLSMLADNLVTVGATAQCQRDEAWSKSNWGAAVELSAPGHKVPVLNYYPAGGRIDPAAASGAPMLVSGTSASAPIVAAIAGVLRSIDPDMPPKEIVRYLRENGFPGDPAIGGVQVLASIPTMQALLDRGVPDSVSDVIQFDEEELLWNNPGLAAARVCGGSSIWIEHEGTEYFVDEEAFGYWNEQGFFFGMGHEEPHFTADFIFAIPTFALDEPYAIPDPVEAAWGKVDDDAGGAGVSGHAVFTDCAILERNPLNETPLQVQFNGKLEGTFNSFDFPEAPMDRLDAFHGSFGVAIIMQNAAAMQTAEQLCTGGFGGGGGGLGEVLFGTSGCAGCHEAGIPGFGGPSLHGIWGTEVELEGGGSVLVDEAYLRESILSPSAKIVAGYDDIMPAYLAEQLSPEEIDALVAYIRDLE